MTNPLELQLLIWGLLTNQPSISMIAQPSVIRTGDGGVPITFVLSRPVAAPVNIDLATSGTDYAALAATTLTVPPLTTSATVQLLATANDPGLDGKQVTVTASCVESSAGPKISCAGSNNIYVVRSSASYKAQTGGFTFTLKNEDGTKSVTCGTLVPMTFNADGKFTISDSNCYHLIKDQGGSNALAWTQGGTGGKACAFSSMEQSATGAITVTTDNDCLGNEWGAQL